MPTRKLLLGKRWTTEAGVAPIFGKKTYMLGDVNSYRNGLIAYERGGAVDNRIAGGRTADASSQNPNFQAFPRPTCSIRETDHREMLRFLEMQSRIVQQHQGEALDLWLSASDLDRRFNLIGYADLSGTPDYKYGEMPAEGARGPIAFLVGGEAYYDFDTTLMGTSSLRQYRQGDRLTGGEETSTLHAIYDQVGLVDSTAQKFGFMTWIKNRSWSSGQVQYIIDNGNNIALFIDTDGTLVLRQDFLSPSTSLTATVPVDIWQPGRDEWFFIAHTWDSTGGGARWKLFGAWRDSDSVSDLNPTIDTPMVTGQTMGSADAARWAGVLCREIVASPGGPEDNDDHQDAFDGWMSGLVWKVGVEWDNAKVLSEFQATRVGGVEFDWFYNDASPTKGGGWVLDRPPAGIDPREFENEFTSGAGPVKSDTSRHLNFNNVFRVDTNGGLGDQFVVLDWWGLADDNTDESVGNRGKEATIANLTGYYAMPGAPSYFVFLASVNTDGDQSRILMPLGNNRTYFHALQLGELATKPYLRYPETIIRSVVPRPIRAFGRGRHALVQFDGMAGRMFTADSRKPNYTLEDRDDPAPPFIGWTSIGIDKDFDIWIPTNAAPADDQLPPDDLPPEGATPWFLENNSTTDQGTYHYVSEARYDRQRDTRMQIWLYGGTGVSEGTGFELWFLHGTKGDEAENVEFNWITSGTNAEVNDNPFGLSVEILDPYTFNSQWILIRITRPKTATYAGEVIGMKVAPSLTGGLPKEMWAMKPIVEREII